MITKKFKIFSLTTLSGKSQFSRTNGMISMLILLFTSGLHGQTTLINYNFNDASPSGYSSYSANAITNISAAITSTETHATPTGGTASGSNAFTSNSTAGNALHASNSSGTNTRFHTITLTGSALPDYVTFGIYFQAQRSSSGAQTITVQYSKDGGSFTTFTSNTMSPGNGSFTEGLFTLPSGADNPTTSLAIRLFFSGASGSGTCRIDNFQIRGTGSGPNISVTGSLTSFITSAISTPSAEQSFSVSGTNLTNNITITPPAGFQVSTTSGSGFGSTVMLTQSSGTVAATTVYARFNPNALSDQAGGNITCTSTGATTRNVVVTGEVLNLSTGSIAFIAFQGQTTDYFRIVALEDIPANTRIWFTDNEWDGSLGTPAFTSGEGNSVWTSPGTTVTAGTVIEFAVTAGTVTTGSGAFTAGLASTQEQLFAYQGTLASPTFIGGYTTGTTITSGTPTDATTWIPSALTSGTNFVAVGTGTSGSAYVTTATHNRSLSDMRSHIHNNSNITTNASTTYSSWPTYTFNIIADEPTTQPSFTAATSVGNNQMTLNFSGGNGTSYMVVLRQGSAVDSAPTDATSYSAVSGSVNFTTATELSAGQRIVYNGATSTGNVTVTNLSPGTAYHFAIYAYNGSGTLTNFLTTSPGTGNQTTTGSANSNASDIIIHTSFTEPSNIAYHSNQENANLTDVNSIEVARFTLRDGGATTDADANNTTLNAITFTITNHAVLRRLALYNGTTELGEVAISSGSASFSGLTLAAADNSSQDFSLRASFAGTVTDNLQFSFAVSSATADPAGSTFAAADAGAAASSTSGDRNRIEVTATLLAFVQNTSNVATNTNMSPSPTVSANDALSNRDLDYTTDMTATTTGTFGSATTTITPVSGLGTFSNLQFSAAATGRTIAVSSGSLTASGNSSNFDITTAVAFSDVIISEISYESTNEWIELHNTTSSSIDISGWYITDHSVYPATGEGDCLIPSSTSIPAGGYLVVSTSGTGSSANDLVDITGEVLSAAGPRGASNRPQLSNSGDNIALYTSSSGGTLIDGSLSVDFPDYSGSGTISIERIGKESWGTAAFGRSSTTFASATYTTSSPGSVGNPTLQANVAVTNLATRTGQIINLSTRTLTIGGTISGSGTINGTTTSNLTITGASGTINFDQTTPGTTNVLRNLTISGSGTTTIGNALNINSGATAGIVTVGIGATLATGGNLTLKSDANGTASIGNSEGTITGNVTVETFIPGGKRAYRLLGHPFSGTIALSTLIDNIHITGANGGGFDATITNNPSAFSFNEATFNGTTNSGWTAFTNTTNTIGAGQGTRILVRGPRSQSNLLDGTNPTPQAATLDFTGAVNQGTVNVAMGYTGASGGNAGWNLIANPYASKVDIGSITAGNRNSIANFSVWAPNNGTRGAYVTTSFGSAYIIPAGAAFFVQTGSAANFTFTEANKSTSAVSATLLKTDPFKLNALQLNVVSNDTLFWDQFVLRNREDALETKDAMDANKMENPDVNFYSTTNNNDKFAIDHRPLTANSVVNLGFNTTSDYHFTFKVANLDMPGYEVYLMDKFLNKQTLLTSSTAYHFTTSADVNSKGLNRFQLVFNKVASGSQEMNTGNHFMAYPNPANSEINISLTTVNKGVYQFGLYNQFGQELGVGDFNFNTNPIQTLNIEALATGVYFIKVSNGDATQTIKFIK